MLEIKMIEIHKKWVANLTKCSRSLTQDSKLRVPQTYWQPLQLRRLPCRILCSTGYTKLSKRLKFVAEAAVGNSNLCARIPIWVLCRAGCSKLCKIWARSGTFCRKFTSWIERFLLQSALLTACSLRDRSVLHLKFCSGSTGLCLSNCVSCPWADGFLSNAEQWNSGVSPVPLRVYGAPTHGLLDW